MKTDDLIAKAKEIRQLMVRALISGKGGHPGGSFSCVEILTALYFAVMRVDPADPRWADRDRFILSKGHAALAYYAALAARGYMTREVHATYRRDGGIMPAHPDMNRVPGVDMSSGSLGQGLSVGAGMAQAARFDGRSYRVFVLLGDGEVQEGQVWEAALLAAHLKLDNLTAIIDRNMLQIDGPTEEILALEPLAEKWAAFGWAVREADGHDPDALAEVLGAAPAVQGRPTVVIARTVKGRGIRLFENRCEWHGMKRRIESDEEQAMLEDVGLRS